VQILCAKRFARSGFLMVMGRVSYIEDTYLIAVKVTAILTFLIFEPTHGAGRYLHRREIHNSRRYSNIKRARRSSIAAITNT